MITSWLRRLRHGPLRGLGPLWVLLGRAFRFMTTRRMFRRSVDRRIGPFGPFRLDGYFAFSDLDAWGSGHNDGFVPFVRACETARTVIDVGAHVGFVTLPAARALGTDGWVVSFEPARRNLELLRRHLILNGVQNVTVVDAVLGAEEGEIQFWERVGEPTGMNSIVRPQKHADDYTLVRHRQTTLDRYCADHDLTPDLVKIDVEGAELDVLRGSREVLRSRRPTLYVSIHPSHLRQRGQSAEELQSFLTDAGYQLGTIGGEPIERFELREYVATPREQP